MSQFILRQTTFATALVVCLSLSQIGFAQLSGSRGGVFGTNPSDDSEFETLDAASAQSSIMVQGKSVMSVKPTSIRIVLALTFEGLSSSECEAGMEEKIARLRPVWNEAGIADEKIVEDFISILPRYEIEVKALGGRDVAMEKKSGYVMQTNIHLAVKDDAGSNESARRRFCTMVLRTSLVSTTGAMNWTTKRKRSERRQFKR